MPPTAHMAAAEVLNKSQIKSDRWWDVRTQITTLPKNSKIQLPNLSCLPPPPDSRQGWGAGATAFQRDLNHNIYIGLSTPALSQHRGHFPLQLTISQSFLLGLQGACPACAGLLFNLGSPFQFNSANCQMSLKPSSTSRQHLNSHLPHTKEYLMIHENLWYRVCDDFMFKYVPQCNVINYGY